MNCSGGSAWQTLTARCPRRCHAVGPETRNAPSSSQNIPSCPWNTPPSLLVLIKQRDGAQVLHFQSLASQALACTEATRGHPRDL